jgi:phosphate transport system permease protein
MVWLTSMGLGLGLAMIAALLWLVTSRGLGVFWPDPIALVKLKESSQGLVGGSRVFAGGVAKTQEKRGYVQPAEGGPEKPLEIQFFTGNRDVLGFSYRYVDVADIAGMEHPADLIQIERAEYGDALGFPARLELPSGKVDAAAPEFRKELGRAVAEAAKRRAQIRKIERIEIGRISAAMEKLRQRQRARKPAGSANREDEQSLAALQEQFAARAAEAAALRARQSEARLVYRLASGAEKTLPAGEIIGFHFPNGMSFSGKAAHFVSEFWAFVSDEPREANTEGGIFPAIFGTFVMTLLMSLAVMPFGVVTAIYLREYATQGALVRAVRIAVNNLAGVPSIVFGVFGLGFFVYTVGGSIDRAFFTDALPSPTFGTGGVFWASLTLALMTVPVVIVATEEALAAVPRGMREGALACGASKWQSIQRVVLPASSTGILTGLILAMARGAGEVAPLMLVGVVKLAPSLPIDGEFPFLHLERKFMHLGFHIYDLGFQSPDSEAAIPMVFATTLFLILLVVLLNLTAIIIRERLRRKYSTGAF